ncbi:serine/threonine-protein kinase [Kitasatospora sp. NPDC048722]|uniref:serine/threonine-protein kinase n=1 Tax=Kitasatospora sp. NPDC048722 TaxID=3155639 RepID=UPI0033F522AF
MLNGFESTLLTLLGAVLVIRLATLPLLVRAQTAARRRALTALGEDASAGAPGGTGATVADAAVVVLTAAAVVAVVPAMFVFGDRLFAKPFDTVNARYISIESHLALHMARTWYVTVFVVCLVLWLGLSYLTQRNVLATGLPRQAWRSGPTQLRVVGLLVLRAVLAVFVLPVILVPAALVFQIVAVFTSLRPKPVGAGAAQRPPLNPHAATVPPQGYVPTQHTPPVPQFAPPAPAPSTAQSQPAPPVPSLGQPLGSHEPRVIGGYQLLGRIGSGGMGTVYLAQRQGSATQVALKTINLELLDDAELLRRFQRESEVLAMVPGAYTARVLDSGVDQGRPYLAMELLDGRPLDVHLREQGPIRSAEALRALALALAVALSGVHRLGLVHRDLKPANIMLTTAGPRLLDFGIAAIVDGTRLTMTGGGPGTLTYMAPEQFGDERVGTAADVWAWACCVVCAAHGASPFAATSTGAVIRRIVETGPEPAAVAAVRDLDPGLAAVVARALAIDPAQRPADGAALLAALAAARQEARQAAPDPAAVHDQITRGWQTLAL